MRRRFSLLALALTSCVAVGPAADRHPEFEWAKSVLLGTEVGDSRNAVVRWHAPVRYLVVAAPPQVRNAVNHAFGQLQEALQGMHALEIEHVAASDARIGSEGFITIFAKAPRHAGALAEQYGAQHPHPGADGWFTIVWNHQFQLTRAVVFLDPDLTDKWLQHTALEEMFQALGPSNDSPVIRDSLLFESAITAGCHDCLARVDHQVLCLLYRGLQPGDRAMDIEQAMQRSWVFADSVQTTQD